MKDDWAFALGFGGGAGILLFILYAIVFVMGRCIAPPGAVCY